MVLFPAQLGGKNQIQTEKESQSTVTSQRGNYSSFGTFLWGHHSGPDKNETPISMICWAYFYATRSARTSGLLH